MEPAGLHVLRARHRGLLALHHAVALELPPRCPNHPAQGPRTRLQHARGQTPQGGGRETGPRPWGERDRAPPAACRLSLSANAAPAAAVFVFVSQRRSGRRPRHCSAYPSMPWCASCSLTVSHARRTAGIRMTLPAMERLVWHCGDHTAKMESASRGRFLIATTWVSTARGVCAVSGTRRAGKGGLYAHVCARIRIFGGAHEPRTGGGTEDSSPPPVLP